jgi:hypothetical protein
MIENPFHKQSEKASMCFQMRRVRTRDFIVFFPNVLWATFIQGAMFILDSTVSRTFILVLADPILFFFSESLNYELCKDWISYRGYHIPNAENCKTYFQCQANPAKKGGYEAILRDCPTGTAFDPSLGNCNHLSKLPRCVIGMYIRLYF